MVKTSSHNPALNHLEVLVGDWEMELSAASFLPSPSDTASRSQDTSWLIFDHLKWAHPREDEPQFRYR